MAIFTNTALNAKMDAFSKVAKMDSMFEASLVKQFQKKGSLSEKQIFWVEKLTAERAVVKAPVKGLNAPVPVPGTFTNLAKSAGGKKQPRFKALTTNGIAIDLVLRKGYGESKAAIAVYAKDTGSNFARWIGKIDETDYFTPANNMATFFTPHVDEITMLLQDLGVDLAGVAKSYGQMTSRCMFCGLLLTDPASVFAGYGPICASHYGLPHGATE